LAQLRDAINSALDNTGVRAALLNTAAGTRLTLTSNQTGVAQAISLSATGGLNSFINGFSVTTPAQDAEVLIDGFQVLSPTNTVTSAVSGVSLELVSAKPGTSLNLTISQDVQANKDKINKLVTDFNAFQSQALRLRAFDSKTRTGGPLIGDSALRNIENSIRRELTGTTASAPANTNSLSSIGIRFGADGRLTVNDSVLTEALTQRPDQVVQMLTATDGLVARVSAVVDAQVSTDGLLTARTNSLDARKRALGKDKEAMETRMLLVEKRYRAQFIGLDRMLTEMQGTSSYIAKIGSGT
jgi:flagellar hook-associated protein 2